MSTESELAALVRAPSTGRSFPYNSKHLSGAGTTEDVTDAALNVGEYATLIVGSVAVKVAFDDSSTGSGKVGSDDLVLGPYTRFDWVVDAKTTYVHTESDDGSSTHHAWVFASGK
jgi:hypothetical protein